MRCSCDGPLRARRPREPAGSIAGAATRQELRDFARTQWCPTISVTSGWVWAALGRPDTGHALEGTPALLPLLDRLLVTVEESLPLLAITVFECIAAIH